MQPGNPNQLMPTNNLQQSNNNLLPPSQGQGQVDAVARDFYSSPDFKPPSFSGEKPLGWFETKYQNWVSNQDGQYMSRVDGKNAPPSRLDQRDEEIFFNFTFFFQSVFKARPYRRQDKIMEHFSFKN